MKKRLIEKCKYLDQTLERLLANLANVPHELLAKRPMQSAWSPLEILQHILIVEKASLQYAKKKTSYPASLRNAGFAGFYRNWLLRLFMALPVKIKAPAIVNEDHFDKNATLASISSDWKHFRAQLTDFLANAPKEWENKLTYRHTFAGRLTFEGMLLLFDLHFKRHKKQLDHTLTALGL